MINLILALSVITILFLSILGCIKIGHSYAIWEEKKAGKKRVGTQITEGAIFALLGLLVAFTFSGAAEKFDHRRGMIIEEANAIENAYFCLDLLPKTTTGALQQDFGEYLEARIDIYKKLLQPQLFQLTLEKSTLLQQKIWRQSVASCTASQQADVSCNILLPALTSMFDIANTRTDTLSVHPHPVVYILLIGIALLSGLLAGYSISNQYLGSALHMVSYAFVVAFIIYVIIDMEHPRQGLIRVDSFDKVLSDLKTKIVIPDQSSKTP